MCIDFIINVFFLFLINNSVIRKACLLSKTCVSSNYTGGKAVKKKQTRNLSLSLLCSAGIKTYEKAVTGSDWACFSDKNPDTQRMKHFICRKRHRGTQNELI